MAKSKKSQPRKSTYSVPQVGMAPHHEGAGAEDMMLPHGADFPVSKMHPHIMQTQKGKKSRRGGHYGR